MKKCFTLILLLVLALGCETESKLIFEMLHFQNDPCDDCPKIQIKVPNALEELRVAKAINTAIEEELIYTLTWQESDDVTTLKGAMISFNSSYQEFQKRFEDQTILWEAAINGAVVYETENVISIHLNSYTFTGGAHGYAVSKLLNFDKMRGVELDNHELFNDAAGFMAFAEKQFRENQKVPLKDAINATGFMFTEDTFYLSENMGFTTEGIQLIYNQYEIASYADGSIQLVISFKDVNPFLKEKYRVKEN